jgi:hypothetical protein
MTAQPSNLLAVEFLKLMYPEGPWVLTAIRPDSKAIETKTFRPESETPLPSWLNRDWNIYCGVNRPMRDVDKKCEREDIKSLCYLHVDVDPRAGEDLESERARILALFTTNLPEGELPPTAVVFSGGGYQGYWKLEQEIPIDGDLAKAEDAKRYNQARELAFGGDNCHNIDRIMRLPGTINLPDERKRKKGRKPELATLVYWNADAVYPIEKFTKAPAAVPAAKGGKPASRQKIEISDNIPRIENLQAEIGDVYGVPARVLEIVAQGRAMDEVKTPDDSRSMWVFDCCCNLLRANVPTEIIFSVLTDPSWGISASIVEKGSGAERYALRQITRAQVEVDKDDRNFDTDATDKPVPTQRNIRVALIKEGVSLRYNVFSRRYEVFGMQGESILTRAVMNKLWLDIEKRYKFRPKKDFFIDVLMHTAYDNPYHPLRDEFDDLVWDGVDRLSTWLTVYLGAKDSELMRAQGEIFLTAQVRRVRDPGCKFDEMLVLEGPQGGEKSTVIEVLARRADWHIGDVPMLADAKVIAERLQGKSVGEVPELKNVTPKTMPQIKAFLSQASDTARLYHEPQAADLKRSCVFIGTTNNKNYLNDPSGNRRFLPVEVGKIDTDALRRDVNQLHAQAAHREAHGGSIRLPEHLWAAANVATEQRRVVDPWVDELRAVLGEIESGKVRYIDVWKVVNVPKERRNSETGKRLIECAEELGWHKKNLRFGGRNPEAALYKGDGKHLPTVALAYNKDGAVVARLDGEAAPKLALVRGDELQQRDEPF